MPSIQASVVIAHGVEVVEDRRRRVPDCWIMNILSEVKALNREVNQVSNHMADGRAQASCECLAAACICCSTIDHPH